jgi:hypothetical protein
MGIDIPLVGGGMQPPQCLTHVGQNAQAEKIGLAQSSLRFRYSSLGGLDQEGHRSFPRTQQRQSFRARKTGVRYPKARFNMIGPTGHQRCVRHRFQIAYRCNDNLF